MNWKFLAVFWLVGAVVLGSASGTRRGSSQTYEGPFVASSATAADPGEVEIPAYSGVAPLTKVRLTVRHHISYAFRLENMEPTNWWGTTQGYPSLYSFPWFRNELGGVTQFGIPSWTISLCWLEAPTAFDGTLDFAGGSGRSITRLWDQCAQPDYWTASVQEIESEWGLAPFRDPDGVVQFEILPMEWLQAVPGIEVPSASSIAGGVNWFSWDVVIDKVEYNPR